MYLIVPLIEVNYDSFSYYVDSDKIKCFKNKDNAVKYIKILNDNYPAYNEFQISTEFYRNYKNPFEVYRVNKEADRIIIKIIMEIPGNQSFIQHDDYIGILSSTRDSYVKTFHSISNINLEEYKDFIVFFPEIEVEDYYE